jgi:hypothetical protein
MAVAARQSGGATGQKISVLTSASGTAPGSSTYPHALPPILATALILFEASSAATL